MARRGRVRRTDDDLENDRRLRPREGRGSSSPPTLPPTSDSARLSRLSTTKSARRSVCRSRGGTPRWESSIPTSARGARPARLPRNSASGAASARTSSCSWPRSATRPAWPSRIRSSTTTRSRPSDLPRASQTIATLSHHIKNILQGHHRGGYLIDLGLNDKDDSIVRRSWKMIVEKNQTRNFIAS